MRSVVTVRRLVSSTCLLLLASGLGRAASCDVNSDGVVNVVDVQLITNMMLGTTTCSANIVGSGVCNNAAVTTVLNAALGFVCHSVSLSWTASASSNVAGYNIYRGGASGGPYTIQNSSPVSGTVFYDANIQAGQPYYYVVRSVDSSNNESTNSNESTVTIPTS